MADFLVDKLRKQKFKTRKDNICLYQQYVSLISFITGNRELEILFM